MSLRLADSTANPIAVDAPDTVVTQTLLVTQVRWACVELRTLFLCVTVAYIASSAMDCR
jgi:hypothetical protein